MKIKSGCVTRPHRAFTLLEVMIAIAIFFMAMFSILALVSQCLRSAHALNQTGPTPGMVAAWMSQTNKLEEGFDDGDFEDIANGIYPDYTWKSNIMLAPEATNSLFQVEIAVLHNGNLDTSMTFLLFRPESTTGLSTKSKFAR
jgi:Tfp pilus assembly protein PilV